MRKSKQHKHLNSGYFRNGSKNQLSSGQNPTKLEQQLDDLSQLGKDLNKLKKFQKQSKLEFNKMKKLKITTAKQTELTDQDHELLRMADKYPNNIKLQKMKQRMLIRKKIIEKDEDASVSS